MIGYQFTQFIPEPDERSPFEKLLEIFLELMVYTSGDVEETFNWMEALDQDMASLLPIIP